MKSKTPARKSWYNQKGMAAVIALLALGIAYVTASRAIDTGSLWQYALTLLFLFIAGIEVGKIVRKEQHI